VVRGGVVADDETEASPTGQWWGGLQAEFEPSFGPEVITRRVRDTGGRLAGRPGG
jgi:hypothetical protein